MVKVRKVDLGDEDEAFGGVQEEATDVVGLRENHLGAFDEVGVRVLRVDDQTDRVDVLAHTKGSIDRDWLSSEANHPSSEKAGDQLHVLGAWAEDARAARRSSRLTQKNMARLLVEGRNGWREQRQ